jgi:hypothetical protein
MSTLLMTDSTSVFASHSGLPVSRAIRSAKVSSSALHAIGKAAEFFDAITQRAQQPQAGQALRAAANGGIDIAGRAAPQLRLLPVRRKPVLPRILFARSALGFHGD